MTKNVLGFGLILILFLVAGFVAWSSFLKVYHNQDEVNIHSFPENIEGWVSEDLPISEKEYAILETRNAFVRKYTSPEGKVVYMFVVYSQSNRKVSHPPEICYTGNGVTVTRSEVDKVYDTTTQSDVRVNRLLLDIAQFQQVSFYWFKVGEGFMSNYWRQQMTIALNALFGRPSSSALLRISSDIRTTEEAAANTIKDFAKLAVPHIKQHLPAK